MMDERKYRLADTLPLNGANWLTSRTWFEAPVTPFDAGPQSCRLLRAMFGARRTGQETSLALADFNELDERELLELGVTRADSRAAPMAYAADQSRGC